MAELPYWPTADHIYQAGQDQLSLAQESRITQPFHWPSKNNPFFLYVTKFKGISVTQHYCGNNWYRYHHPLVRLLQYPPVRSQLLFLIFLQSFLYSSININFFSVIIIFVAAHSSLVAESRGEFCCGVQPSHSHGFFSLQSTGSRHTRSVGVPWALERGSGVVAHRLSCSKAWALFPD